MKKNIITLLLAGELAAAACCSAQDYLRYVDPYIGSGGHGHVFVGASMPFGAIQAGPQNIFKGWDWCSGYHYSDSIIIGFSHTHLNGTGCADLGDIQVMPYTGDIRTRRGEQDDISGSCASYYSHKNETVSPDYYSLLMDNGVRAELTATTRVAYHRYTFTGEKPARVLVNLREGNGFTPVESSIRLKDKYTVIGHKIVHGWSPEHRVYFALRTEQPITDLLVFNDDTPAGKDSLRGVGVKGVLIFDKSLKNLNMKVSISSVSAENALENIETELPHWDFDKVRKASQKAWNAELSRVKVEDSDERAKRIFYTAMYHTLIAPTTYCDVNGEYRGHDKLVHHAEGINYSTFSLWDTYRALHPWFTIIQSDRVGDMINSMLSIFDQQGKLPVWPLLGGETNQMPGYSGVPVVCDAALKGIGGFDRTRALNAAVRSAENRNQNAVSWVLDNEYIPCDKVSEATSVAMEYAVDDWGIAALSKRLGDMKTAAEFEKRSQYYRHYMDTSIRFIRPKLLDGSWLTPYNPFQSIHGGTGYFAEGTGWQYTFLVPQDPYGLIGLMGGDKGFINKIDSLFQVNGDMGAQASADISGLIGQYAHGNEPSHHIAYLYPYAGRQWRTAEIVRYIQEHFYTDKTDGIIGNEDCGQMSSWHILSALGFYQVNPSCGIYTFGSPLFEKATLNMPNGKRFTITTKNNNRQNIYIQSVRLNGRPYNNSYIRYKDIVAGGNLEFEMGAQPNKLFGADPEYRPYNENR